MLTMTYLIDETTREAQLIESLPKGLRDSYTEFKVVYPNLETPSASTGAAFTNVIPRNIIYAAIERGTGIEVVLKEPAKDRGGGRTLEEEANLTLRLKHPSIINGKRPIAFDDRSFFPMERLDTDISQYLCSNYRTKFLGKYMRDLAKAIQYCHEQDIIHRDIKPQNTGLRVVDKAQPTAVLFDFEIALELNGRKSKTTAVTGTPGFMAPEWLMGQYSPLGEIYSFGKTIVEALKQAYQQRQNRLVTIANGADSAERIQRSLQARSLSERNEKEVRKMLRRIRKNDLAEIAHLERLGIFDEYPWVLRDIISGCLEEDDGRLHFPPLFSLLDKYDKECARMEGMQASA